MSKIAAAYIRASTGKQEASPAVQRDIITKFAAANDYVIPADLWFVDSAVSASKVPLYDRPEGSRLINCIISKKTRSFNEVIIWCLDRVFRDMIDQETTFAIFAKHKASLVGVTQDLARNDSMQTLFLQIMGAVAQAESKRIGERTRIHNISRHESGKSISRPPHGLSKVNKEYIVNPIELETIIAVFQHFADSCGNSTDTCRRLTRAGIKPVVSDSCGLWVPQMVRQTLLRPAYRRMESYAGDLRDKSDVIPETIPPDLLKRVDAILEQQYGHWYYRKKQIKAGAQRYTYTSLLKCGLCGNSMVLNEPNAPSRRFRCMSKYFQTDCECGSIHAHTIDWLVGESIRIALEDIANLRAVADNPKPTKRPTLSVEAKLKAIEDKRTRVLDMYVDGKISGEEYARQTARINNEQLSITDSPIEPKKVDTIDSIAVSNLLSSWSAVWPKDLVSTSKREILVGVLGIPKFSITATRDFQGETRKHTEAIYTVSVIAPKLTTNIITASRVGTINNW